MRMTLSQRLDRLEARNTGLRERLVWWSPERGEPEPRAAPGEQVVIGATTEFAGGEGRRRSLGDVRRHQEG